MTFGAYEFLPDEKLLRRQGVALPVSGRALAILGELIEADGALVSSHDLVERVWGGRKVDAANLRIHIASLRELLGADDAGVDYVHNVPGRGYCLATPVRRHAAVEPAPSPVASGAVRAAETGLVGRDEAVRAVADKLRNRRFVSIVGPGGIGKTRLAKAVAAEVRDDHRDGVLFVDLGSVVSPEAILQAVGSMLDAAAVYEHTVQSLARGFAGKDILLVIDNCEQVVDPLASLCEALQRAAPELDLLCTSREALRADGEWLYRLAPLFVPGEDDVLGDDAIARFPALDLFLRRARANAADVASDAATLQDVAVICRALDGIPLAIELAAATVGVFGIGGLRERLADRLALLTRGRRNALPRHRTLRATIDWSYDLLAPDEQDLLRCLAVFAGPFNLGAVVAVSSFGAAASEAHLFALEAKSLVIRDDAAAATCFGPGPAFRLLETTALYAREKLDLAGDADRVVERHARQIGQLLDAALRPAAGSGAEAPVAARRGLQDNLVVVLRAAFAREATRSAAVALTAVATSYWLRNVLLVANRPFIEQALEHIADSGIAGSEDELTLRTALGLAEYYENGPSSDTTDFLREALALARGLDRPERTLDILWMIYGISGNAGHYDESEEFARAYQRELESTEPSILHYRGHRMLGRALHDLGRHAEAKLELARGLEAVRDRDRVVHFTAYHNDHWTASRSTQARLLWVTGDVDGALEVADQCLAEAVQLDHAQSLCWAVAFNLAPVSLWCGDLDRTQSDVDLLLSHSRRTFQHWHDWGQSYAQLLRLLRTPGEIDAGAFRILSDTDAQSDLLATIHPAFLRHDPVPLHAEGRASWCLAEHLRAAAVRAAPRLRDERDRAKAILQKSLALARAQGAASFALRAAISLAELIAPDGRRTSAAALLHDALASITDSRGTADSCAARTLLRSLE